MADFWDNFKHALRMFRANPGFTFAALAALALGIGINTAIFTVVDDVLLKPLTYPDPDRIVQFLITSPQGDGGSGISIPNFVLFEQQTGVFQDVAAYDWGGPGFNLTGDRPEQVSGVHVTQGYFRLFGAPVILGRTFTTKEDSPNGGKVAVLSYGLWQRKFGGNPNIIGTALSLGNEPYTVVGVLGKSFVSDAEADILLPFQFDPNSTNQGHYFSAAARLKPGVTLAQANALLKVTADQFRRRYPRWLRPKEVFAVEPLRDMVVGDARKSLLVMLGAVNLVLLIACANVANLLLIRATGRRREFAIRAALGASRSRIVFQLLMESVLLSLSGGVLGLLLGYIGLRGLLAMSPGDIPRIGEHGGAVSMDWRVLAFTLAVSLFTGILFGLFPALGASRPDLNSTLKDSSNRSGTGFRQSKVRSLLVISEISLAMVLLIGASLLIRTFLALHKVSAGFDSHNVLTLQMSLTGDRFQKTAGVAQLVRDGRERLNAIPGIETSASVSCLPMDSNIGMNFLVAGRPVDDPLRNIVDWVSASAGYLDVFKIPLLRGRNFTDHDVAGAQGVVLINESMAKKYWPKEDPVGQQIIIGKGVGPEYAEPPREIIGIVGDTHNDGPGREPRPQMIVPQAQVTDGMTALTARMYPVTWVVRTHTDPHQLIPVISEQLRQASGGFPVAQVRSMDEVVAGTTARESFNMLLLSIFGASALVLASIGIYGLMAYSVQQRTQEMGIRMALGADRSRIRNLVVWQGMQLTIAGVVVGAGAAFGLTRLIASLLFGVKSWDPTVFVTVPVVLAAVALLAVWLPATRASRLDPIEALRVE